MSPCPSGGRRWVLPEQSEFTGARPTEHHHEISTHHDPSREIPSSVMGFCNSKTDPHRPSYVSSVEITTFDRFQILDVRFPQRLAIDRRSRFALSSCLSWFPAHP